jgi:acetoin utilization protein AcuB
MKIASIMTPRVATVEMDDTLRTINGIFCCAKFHHVLVVDNKKLVGIISDRDLLKASSPFLETPAERPQDLARLTRKAHQIMSREPVTTSGETTITEAVQLLLENNVSCLPVVSADGQIEGIITWKDLINAYRGLQGDLELACCNCGATL